MMQSESRSSFNHWTNLQLNQLTALKKVVSPRLAPNLGDFWVAEIPDNWWRSGSPWPSRLFWLFFSRTLGGFPKWLHVLELSKCDKITCFILILACWEEVTVLGLRFGSEAFGRMPPQNCHFVGVFCGDLQFIQNRISPQTSKNGWKIHMKLLFNL